MTGLALIALVLFIALGTALFGLSISLLWHLAAGLVVGALARLALPGEEKISLLGTALVGMAGSALGHVVGNALHLGGLLQLGLGVGIAAALLAALGFRAKRA